MIIRKNVPIYSICWLNHAEGGVIGLFYEPENRGELIDICKTLYREERHFDIIGYTSNTYFLPNYNADIIVSTRKVKDYKVYDNYIVADCGVSVSKLSREMVDSGVKGFEGLVDLPGTVAAAVYGNASCYGCSINNLLVSLDLLIPNGEVITLNKGDLLLAKRSSALKRGELRGVILAINLRRENGEVELLKDTAAKNRERRKRTQPGPKDNLGSIYKNSKKLSLLGFLIRTVIFFYGLLIDISGKENVNARKKKLCLKFLGASEIYDYLYGWNRYIWKDAKSHELFWRFHEAHKKMFKESEFEIEIKGEHNC